MRGRAWLVALLGLPIALGLRGEESAMQTQTRERVVGLPAAAREGGMSLEAALKRRRSVREYARAPLSLAEVAQLAWATQGLTGREGKRTAPSAGALYPLELHVVAGEVDGLEPGVYRYQPATHHLLEVVRGDPRAQLGAAALGQEWIREAPVVLVLAAVYERTTARYGARGERYALIEIGHAAQNACLQATALGLGSVVVGAFDDARVRRVLSLAEGERPLVLVPVGRLR